jgi:hypothetical protein
MTKKVIVAAIACITICLINKTILKTQQRALRRRVDKLRAARPKERYSFEYTL